MDLLFSLPIFICSALALLWSYINARYIWRIKIVTNSPNEDEFNNEIGSLVMTKKLESITVIGDRIAKGARTFLFQEYMIMGIFILAFSIVVLLVVDIFGQETTGFRFFATASFVIGSLTSILCGWIGMSIAVQANYRTTYSALESLQKAFTVAFRAGCVMGFSSVGLGLGILTALMLIFTFVYKPDEQEDPQKAYAVLMELLAGYGLGGLAGSAGGYIPKPRTSGLIWLARWSAGSRRTVLRTRPPSLIMSGTTWVILLGWAQTYLAPSQSPHVLLSCSLLRTPVS